MKQYVWISNDKNDQVPIEFYGEFDWDKLSSEVPTLKSNLRFTLYDTTSTDTEVLFFDIDDVPLGDRLGVAECIKQIYGAYDSYYVDTGGGVHAYILLDHPYTREDMGLKRNYYVNVLCRDLSKELANKNLGGHVDLEVFSYKKLGRVPGSYNTKHGAPVSLLDSCVTGKKFPSKTLEDREPTTKLLSESKLNSMILPDVVYKECGAVQDFVKNFPKYSSYSLWFIVGNIFKGIGKLGEFIKLSEKIPGLQSGSIEKIKDSNETYRYGCSSVRMSYVEKKMENNPCKTCIHNVKGNHPLYISGSLPSPTRKSGFIQTSKQDSKGNIIPLDPPKVFIDDLVNDYINRNANTIRKVEESSEFWRFNGVHWELSEDKSLQRGTGRLRADLYKMPNNFRLDFRQRQQVDICFKEHTGIPLIKEKKFDCEDVITFKNTAFKLDVKAGTMDEIPLAPTTFNRSALDVDYDPEAKCPHFDEFLKFCCDGNTEMENILKVIMGLSIAGVSPQVYQKFFWLTGNSGAGKSTFANVLRMLVGTENYAMSSSMSVGRSHSMPDLRGKLVYVLDDVKPSLMGVHLKGFFNTMLLELTGSGGYSLKLPYLPSLTTNLNCVPVITSNESIDGVDSLEGLLRRYTPVSFYKIPDDVDYSLSLKMQDERMGMIHRAVEGLYLYLDGELDRYNPVELKDDARYDDADPIRTFISEYYTLGTFEDTLLHKDIYQDYCDYLEIPNDMDRYKIRSLIKKFKLAWAEINRINPASVSWRSSTGRGARYVKRRVMGAAQE